MRILVLAIGLALSATWATNAVAQAGQLSGQPIPSRQSDKTYDYFVRQWTLCFSDTNPDVSMKGCDVTLLWPHLLADDVEKLKARRNFLRIERELEIDRYLSQKSIFGGTSEAPLGGNRASSNASPLTKSPELSLEKPLQSYVTLDILLVALILAAMDVLKWLRARLTEAAQGNANSTASADSTQAPVTIGSPLAEQPSWLRFEQIVQGDLNFSESQGVKQTTEAHLERFQQAKTIHVASPSGGGGSMQLKLRRSQRSGGVVSSKVFFALDARADLSAEEKVLVSKYGLGKLVVYDSDVRKKHQEAAYGHFDEATVSSAGRGWWKNARGLASAAMMALSLRITIDGLMGGQHIECKDLDELLGAEAAILNACKNLRAYLDTAQTFDGREEVVEF